MVEVNPNYILEECPICRGAGMVVHEGGWNVQVECADCSAHTVYVEYENEAEKKAAEEKVVTLWNIGKVVSSDVVHSVNGYFAAYIALIALSTLCLSLDNFNFETTFSAVVACFNNIGPGFDMVGAAGNYSAFSDFGKLVLCADMLLGRLEIFPILLLFSPSLWRRTK